MAKKKAKQEEVVNPIKSRKEVLREQREAAQNQTVRRAALGIIGLLAVVFIIGLVVEYLIVPRQPVAEVNGERITLAQWQEMVRYQRARLIVGIEDQYDLFLDEEAEDPAAAELQAIGAVQQFSGQQLALLTNAYQFLGEFVLEQMVTDALVRQGAAERGITVSQAEIDAAVGEQFSYYNGGLPTPVPTASPSPQPTPSLTPLPTFTPEGFVITDTAPLSDTAAPEAVPTEVLPTSTPRPTATAVSAEAFQTEVTAQDTSLDDLGANPDLFRLEVENSLYRDKMAEAIFAEQDGATDAEQASAFFILAYSEATANELATKVAAEGYLTVWNELRSNPPVPADAAEQPASAQELLWRTEDDYNSFFEMGTVPSALFSLEIGQPSGLLLDSQSGTPVWVITQVSGREVRPLTESALDQKKQDALQAWLEGQRLGDGLVQYENWRTRVPRQPVLDTKFTQQIAQPEQPAP